MSIFDDLYRGRSSPQRASVSVAVVIVGMCQSLCRANVVYVCPLFISCLTVHLFGAEIGQSRTREVMAAH